MAMCSPEERIERAKELEKNIADFRRDDSHVDPAGMKTNVVEELNVKVREIAGCYQDAIGIYCELNKEEDAKRLINSLFNYVETCHWNSSSIAITFLLSIERSLGQLEIWLPGTRVRLKQFLHSSIYHKLSQYSIIDLQLVMKALRLMNQLAGNNEQERRTQIARLCNVIELAAHTDLVNYVIAEHPTDKQGKLANAISLYDEGRQVAQSIDISWAQNFADKSSHFRNLLHQMPPEPLFSEPLGAAVAKVTAKQHAEPFLPSIAEFQEEYRLVENKLGKLLSDKRLLLDASAISLWVTKHPNSSLKDFLSQRDRSGQPGFGVADSNANPIGVVTLEDEFRIQYLVEIEQNVAALFGNWRELGELTSEQILGLLQQAMPYHDWELFSIGLAKYFQGQDFISAAHILVLQFEGTTIAWARSRGITKKVRQGEQGEYYLSDLIQDNQFRKLQGENICDLIYWYMVNRKATQFNYRNNLAHGFITAKGCNWEHLSAMAMWLTLKIATGDKHTDASVT